MRHDRLKRTIAYSLSRPEAYLIVGLVFASVVVAIAGKWPGWVIGASLLVGAALMTLLIIDSLSDPNAERNASIADVDLTRLTDPALQAKVKRALDYVVAAHKLARRDTSGVLDAADDELPDMEDAARSVYQMTLRLQEFRSDPLLKQDLAELRSQRDCITDDQRAQLDTLRHLDDLVRSAEAEIDSSLAHLGRSYAEMQAIRVTPEFRGRAVDALNQLKASSRRLADLAKGYDEVFPDRTPATEP